MPRSLGLMRPSGVTAVASVNTSAAPPTAREPRCTRCQSVAKPSWLVYWHIGETTMRLRKLMLRMVNGANRSDIVLVYGVEGPSLQAPCCKRLPDTEARFRN